jgi:hypothetical protein
MTAALTRAMPNDPMVAVENCIHATRRFRQR